MNGRWMPTSKSGPGSVAWGMLLYTFAFISYFVLVACSFFNPEWDYAISTVDGAGNPGHRLYGAGAKTGFQQRTHREFFAG